MFGRRVESQSGVVEARGVEETDEIAPFIGRQVRDVVAGSDEELDLTWSSRVEEGSRVDASAVR